MKILIVVGLCLLTFPALAQSNRPLPLTGNVIKDIGTAIKAPLSTNSDPSPTDIWQKIIGAALPDLDYAKALSDSANTAGSKGRSECYQALITANKQAQGTDLKNADGTVMVRPDPHLFTDVEQLSEVLDNLSPTGPVFTGCAKAAQAVKMNVLQFINIIVTGAAGAAALGVT